MGVGTPTGNKGISSTVAVVCAFGVKGHENPHFMYCHFRQTMNQSDFCILHVKEYAIDLSVMDLF